MNLTDEIVDVLRDLADRDGTTMTEVLKRAIAVQKYLADEQADGKKVIIEDPENNTSRQLLIK